MDNWKRMLMAFTCVTLC